MTPPLMPFHKDDLPYALAQVASLCRKYPTESKVLFVPSRQTGLNLLTALVREGIDWVNMEALSPREHAERRFEAQLGARGLRPLHGDTAILVIADLLRELKDREPNSYFEPVGVTPSLARSVWETLQALRTAGITVRDLEGVETPTAKTRALAQLMQGFDDYLRASSQYDAAFALDFAIRSSSDAPLQGVAAVFDETPLNRRTLRYLRQSFGDRIYRIGREDYGLPVPTGLAGSVIDVAPMGGGTPGFAASIHTAPLSDASRPFVHLFGSRGPDGEIGDVIRYCLEHEVPFDDVEVAYSNATAYVPLLVDVSDRFNVDVSFAGGVPANLTRPGAGLLGFLEWIGDNCSAARLASLMQAGLISFHRVVDEVTPPDLPGLIHVFRQAVLDEGIERYQAAVDRLGHAGEVNVEGGIGETPFQRRVRLLSRCVESLVETVPNTSRLGIDLASKLCVTFLDLYSVVHGERDERARESLRDRFEQFSGSSDTVFPTRLALQLVADMVERHTVQASTAAPGTLHAVIAERAGYSGREHVFVVGLDVDNFPGRSAEDPILLDVERRELSLNLDLKSSQATDRLWHLVRVLGMAPGHVHFGASTFNAEREESVIYPSPFFQTVAGRLGVDYLKPPPISGSPFHVEDSAALVPQRRRVDYAGFVSGRYPWMASGSTATAARKSAEFTDFDGWLDQPNPSLGYADEGTVFSPNRLEKLAACPYRYFLHYVLGVRRPDYYEPDPTRWLGPRELGTLLHDLYHHFLRDLADAGEAVNVAKHRPKILAMLSDLVQRYVRQYPPDNQAAFEYEKQRLEHSALAFLQTEADVGEARPTLLEFVFGGGSTESEVQANPVSIRLADDLSFRLRGRIDRVDVLPDDSLAIWDYKTGSSSPYDQGALLAGGLNLQWALYAYVMEELGPQIGLSGAVSTSGYYFASDRENGRRIGEPPPSREEMYSVLAPLFDLVRQGAFLHVIKKRGECRFCDFRTICEKEAKQKKDLRDTWVPNGDLPFIGALTHWMEEAE